MEGSILALPMLMLNSNQNGAVRSLLGERRRGGPRNRLYTCTGNNFEGMCKYIPVLQLGTCMPTPDELRDGVAAARTQKGRAYLYQEEGCAGEFVEVNVDGVSGIQGVVYNSWLVPP
ncbi:hypothetical protein RSOLAG1IB_02507 [Rhizoctonia solani AG-1 IB]|uniref:Uncharacterized protein n=1 Tax=Thanatephorus cucumeris (strain AG1-IB / isolate 7/3/14) TaxID=1108050 RepID=A0A0B7FNG9_THACB|nr:hypothetical protein RSOLAG1IB_02507 [Rhizoctonia solani AG-1 IB]